ncbi:hypothetical protein [Actinopolymorpha alba]|uniref:hypothetical protein n=1 Tax=Actinopolymorpha alba TaxID=533267 RepID=UPI00036D5999|nr:hypothetical protein [Actinopolymorpha alba]
MFGRSPRTFLGIATGSVIALIGATLSANAVADPRADNACTPKQFFVSPQGSDRARGTKTAPWKTLEHARDHIRKNGLNSATSMRCDIVVNLQAGDYPVNKTIDFKDGDSGSNGHQVIYRSADGPGKARFLGAKEVTGWEPYKGNIYRTQVDKNKLFYTLFEGRQRATTARTPNRNNEETFAPYLVSTNEDPARWNTPKWLSFKEGDWDPAWEPTWGDLADAQVVVWSGHDWVWFTDTVPIQNMSWNKTSRP